MSLVALALAFASAIIHALWNVLLKRAKNIENASTGVFVISMVLSGGVSLFLSGKAFPEPAALGWGLAAGACEGCYFVGLVQALRRAPLGWSYAWMRGSSIALVWPVSVLLLAEAFQLRALLCVIVVCTGLMLLGVGSGGTRKPGALSWALAAGACIAGFNLFYKLSLAHGAQPLALFSLSMAVGVPIQLCVRMRRSGWAALRIVPEQPALVAVAGFLCALGFSLFLVALAMSGAGAVTTIRNTSVAFTMLFSLALGERPGASGWAGAALVTLGAVGLGWR